jgi:drug/metabolite transporter (DMT)-like permease
MKFSPRSVGLMAAVTTVLIWTSFIVIASASASHNLLPLDIGFLRILGASSVLLPWGWWLMRAPKKAGTAKGSFFSLSPLPWRTTAAAGLFGGLLYAVLAYSGFFYAPAMHASVLLPGSLPLWTALLALLVLKDPISKNRGFGLMCILAGDVLVGGASLLKAFDGTDVWKGDVLFMSAAVCWGMYSVLVRRDSLNAIRATMAITAFACVTFVPSYAGAAWMGWIPSHLATAPWKELWFQALFQGVGSVAISGITFNMMIRHYGPVRSTMITALVPGLSALGAVAVLNEPMHLNVLAGLALVTCGILFGLRKT